MLAKSKKQLEVSFEKEVRSDFGKIKQLPENKRMDATFKIISNILKSAIGKPHEYTIEESLFILNEELNIPSDKYSELKKILLYFSYFKYANHKKRMSDKMLEDFENKIVQTIPIIIPLESEQEAIKIYESEKNKKKVTPEDNKIHLQLKMHKKDLLQEEKNILKAVENEMNDEIQEAKEEEEINDDIKEEATEIENFCAQKTQQFSSEFEIAEKELEDKYTFENTNLSEEKTDNEELNKLLENAPDFIPRLNIQNDDFSDLDKIKISFKDLFESTTEFPLEEVINYEFDPRRIKTKGWDLHIKYHLLKGNSPEKIKQHYQEKVEEFLLEKLLSDNKDYPKKTIKYSYLKPIQEIIIALTLALIFGKNLEKESKTLSKKGFSKKEVQFVMENLVKSF